MLYTLCFIWSVESAARLLLRYMLIDELMGLGKPSGIFVGIVGGFGGCESFITSNSFLFVEAPAH